LHPGARPQRNAKDADKLQSQSCLVVMTFISDDLSATTTKRRLRRPLHHPSGGPPPPFSRGRIKQSRSRDACAPELCLSHAQISPPKEAKEGRRSADRRIVLEPRHANECCHPFALRARQRPQRRPLASRRSTAALATQMNATAQPRPCFLRLACGGRYPPNAVPVQRCTSQTGRSAGRRDAQAAREWGYKPHPREPHSLHRSAVTSRRPFDERALIRYM